MEGAGQQMTWDYLLHGGNIAALMAAIAVMVKVLKVINRDETLKRDYPPHRHVNGSRILYPQEFQPSPIERLSNN